MVNFLTIQTLEILYQIEYENSRGIILRTIDDSHLLSFGHGCTFQNGGDSEQVI